MAKSDFSYVKTRFSPGFCHCTAVLQTQVPKLCTALDLGFLYILILGTYSKFARENNFLSLSVCFPQPCSSAGGRIATSRSRLQNYRRIVSFPQQKFRWNALWAWFHWESASVQEILNPTLRLRVKNCNWNWTKLWKRIPELGSNLMLWNGDHLLSFKQTTTFRHFTLMDMSKVG